MFQLENIVENYKEYLIKSSRTAKLWLLYIYYVGVVKMFVQAERSDYWKLHIVAISTIFNLFAATGHINYAKNAHIHLQNVQNLKNTHPWVYEQFIEGRLHTVRRSEKSGAGLWTHLIIEEVIMQSIKNRGGLTRGRGFTESMRQLLLRVCTDVLTYIVPWGSSLEPAAILVSSMLT